MNDTILTYLLFRQDITYAKDEFNEVDALILSMLSYIDLRSYQYKKITLNQIDESKLDQKNRQFIHLLKQNVRFKNIWIEHYIDERRLNTSVQFSAMHIHINNHLTFIAFRGTDDSYIGWKENWSMIYEKESTSQHKAIDYLEKTIKKKWFHHYYIGGHSKGGNIAVYAFYHIHKKYLKSIKRIYNFDGPGFHEALESFPNSPYITQSIYSYTPEYGLIGQCFPYQVKMKTIKARGESFEQHDGFNWLINKNKFYSGEINQASINVSKAFNEWINQIKIEDRQLFVESLFEVLDQAHIYNIHDFLNLNVSTVLSLLKAMKHIDNEKRNLIIKLISQFIFIQKTSSKIK